MDQQRNSFVDAATAVLSTELQPKIYKLNINCFETIFDYLSLEDLSSFSQTCKLMQKVAGHILRSKYPFLRIFINHFGDCWSDRFGNQINLNMLIEYMKSITLITHINSISLSRWEQLKSVKYFRFMSCTLSNAGLETIKPILDTVNAVELRLCEFESAGCIQRMFELCKSLKYLSIRCSLDYSDTAWLSHKYPKLEHLAILPMTNEKINELSTFFELNPNVRHFMVDSDFLWINRVALRQAKLNELFIYLSNDICYKFNDEKIIEYCNGLNEWYAEGIFKRLHIIGEFKQQIVDKLIAVKGLVGLQSTAWNSGTNLGSLSNLETLQFDHITKDTVDVTQLAMHLQNLKEISFFDADFNTIIPFIQYVPHLKKIIIKYMASDKERNVLLIFNRERKKLCEIMGDVSKVTIFVPEAQYLSIRWKSVTMYLDLIEIRPFEQHETVLFDEY